MPGHLLDGLMFALQVLQPTAHPEHISHTNTHLPHSTEPLHHQKWPVFLSLNVAPHSERTNKSSDLLLICSLASPWGLTSTHIKEKHATGVLSISPASCLYHGVVYIGTGQRDMLQLEMETRGLLPLTQPRCSTKKKSVHIPSHTEGELCFISPAAGDCC